MQIFLCDTVVGVFVISVQTIEVLREEKQQNGRGDAEDGCG